jgi:glycosyltransferase involved in cell wall biosynthesis
MFVNQPLITVGIPFYNSEKTLLDAVRSIFAQTLQDWELILVDDGSTDRSLEIAQSIDDERVRVLSDGKNKKLPARLNQIIDNARGKYIARMDADDLCIPLRLEKQIQRFQQDTQLDVVGTGMGYIDDQDRPVGTMLLAEQHEQICRAPYRTFQLSHPSIIARKSWYEKFRYDETITLGQDFHLWLRSYQQSKFANVPEYLYCYRLESSFRLKKQCKDRHLSAGYLFDHYRNQKQFSWALLYAMMQYLRMTAEIAYCTVGAKQKLLARRYQTISNNERQALQAEIQNVIDTKLPILES